MEDSTESKAILDRLKKAAGAKSKTDLARVLGIAQQSVFNAQAKGKVPEGWVRKVADTFNVSTDWLYYGVGNMYRTGAAESSPGSSVAIDRQVLLDVVETLEDILDSAKKKLPPKAKAELVYQLYMLVLEEEADNRKPLRIFKLVQGALAVNE